MVPKRRGDSNHQQSSVKLPGIGGGGILGPKIYSLELGL